MRAQPEHDASVSAIAFADYLEAKFALDERSLNPDVRQACVDRIGSERRVLRWLDVGTGAGAMVHRLIAGGLQPALAVTALDRDAELLGAASVAINAQLETQGYGTLVHSAGIDAQRSGQSISIGFQCQSLFDFEPVKPACYDLITAHAFMDMVPMAAALSRFSRWLAPDGVFYATLNYDGDTAIFPVYREEGFETALLAEYDASMERRRVLGEATGGAHSGRRLHALLSEMGFDVAAYGSSDWDITPRNGRYRDRDADVLRTLLAWIHDEGAQQPAIEPAALAHWYAERRARIERSELGMIVHQLDVVATRDAGSRALT
jgi:SAM-dependent methyltransferase